MGRMPGTSSRLLCSHARGIGGDAHARIRFVRPVWVVALIAAPAAFGQMSRPDDSFSSRPPSAQSHDAALLGPPPAPRDDASGRESGTVSDSSNDEVALNPSERLPIGPRSDFGRNAQTASVGTGVSTASDDASAVTRSRPDRDSDPRAQGAPPATLSSMKTVAALAVVVVLIFGLKWVIRHAAGRVGGLASQLGPGGHAPSGVVSILARYPVARGQSLVIVQLDRRILLLNQTSEGFRTLSEVVDPEEVASILIKTRDDENDSFSSRFTGLLKRSEREPDIMGHDEWSVGGPTTIDAAMRLFPETSVDRVVSAEEALSSARARLARIEGGAL